MKTFLMVGNTPYNDKYFLGLTVFKAQFMMYSLHTCIMNDVPENLNLELKFQSEVNKSYLVCISTPPMKCGQNSAHAILRHSPPSIAHTQTQIVSQLNSHIRDS
jgi:hypothetical protein